ncbi:glycosyltransferase family protein [bacterium]|nr:glycosyltransferase family protein [bacterium]
MRDSSVVAIIQARMGSSRLPGKVLKDIGGQPMLFRVVVRARHAQTLGRVVVATTTDPNDDPLFAYCRQQGFAVYRGDPYDVLDRYYQAAVTYGAKTVVRLTADCPLIDPAEIDRSVRTFRSAGVDFAANRLPPPWNRTTPIGMDTEVVTMAALTRAWREARAKYAREHVMPYLYEEPGRFKTLLVDHEPDWGALRLTVDTAEDLDLARELTAFFGNGNDFGMAAAVQALVDHPEWAQINAGVDHKSYRDVDNRG